MNMQRRLSLAAVRVAALRGLAAAGGEPSPAQLARAGRPLVEDLRSKPPLPIDSPKSGSCERALRALPVDQVRPGQDAGELASSPRCS